MNHTSGRPLRWLLVTAIAAMLASACNPGQSTQGTITLTSYSLFDGATLDIDRGLIVAGEVTTTGGDAIERVDLTIENVATGQSWNGDKWVAGTTSFRASTGDDGHVQTAAYSVRVGTADVAAGDYSVTISADSTGGSSTVVGPFAVTMTANAVVDGGPESTILRPFDGIPMASDTDMVVRGYSIDPDGVASITANVFRAGEVWDGSSWGTAPAPFSVPLTDPGATTTSFTHTIPAAAIDGGDAIQIEFLATDSLGNVEHLNAIPRPKGVNSHTNIARIPVYDVAPGAVRIWALGDSITQQGGSFGQDMVGYRYFLDQQIEAAGCHADWVGSLDWNWSEDTSIYPDWTDRQHDGLAAWSVYHTKTYIAQTWQTIPSPTGNRPGYDLAAATNADIALIHLGTNGSLDVTQDNAVPGMTALESAEFKAIYNTLDMETLLGDVRSALGPNADIFFAQIINSHRPSSAPVPPINTPRMINEYINQGYADIAAADPTVNLVDMATGYDPNWNLDALHPSNVGAVEMANRWYAELANTGALSGCL